MAKKQEYSFATGAGKSFKNMLVTYALPAIVYLIAGATEWMPSDMAIKLAPVFAFVSYLIKNAITYKK